MNHIEIIKVKQPKKDRQQIGSDLRQAIKIINAEYQQIDYEDQLFLNRVLTDTLKTLENKGDQYVGS